MSASRDAEGEQERVDPATLAKAIKVGRTLLDGGFVDARQWAAAMVEAIGSERIRPYFKPAYEALFKEGTRAGQMTPPNEADFTPQTPASLTAPAGPSAPHTPPPPASVPAAQSSSSVHGVERAAQVSLPSGEINVSGLGALPDWCQDPPLLVRFYGYLRLCSFASGTVGFCLIVAVFSYVVSAGLCLLAFGLVGKAVGLPEGCLHSGDEDALFHFPWVVIGGLTVFLCMGGIMEALSDSFTEYKRKVDRDMQNCRRRPLHK